ncbi:MAG: VCBS repeat-containing protein [Sandaracinaceae bacterium]|nr:VCBS repeat-containing protein [Sandaracinaceae bacterium]
MQYWSTMRAADVNGDGRADLCARSATDLRCVLWTGAGFGEPIVVAGLSDESGWADVANYSTLRAGDVNGDGAEDLCIRANAGVRCFTWDGAAFVRVTGPEWSDASGWGSPRFYQTLRMADVDGDGLDDACARAAAGWRCHPSLGDSFADPVVLDELRDDGGWGEPRYFSTILMAGRACRPEQEVCNGRDDDCDGLVDEHAAPEICNGLDDDCDGEVDEHAAPEICNGIDDDCDGEIDEIALCAQADAGVPGDGSALRPSTLNGSCGCRAAGAGGPSAPWWLLAPALFLVRRKRA